jgi:hypothetical protein
MKGNTIFLESATANIGDLEALIPIMLDPGNQISFKSGHCRVGDQVVVLPAWGRKDQFLAIKGWGAYELSKESFLVFYKMDWTYEGYPGRCTTYSEGYIWKERFWWTTIPGIPAGYPEYFDLQVMRKGLEGHPDPSNSNYPQNCSDGTAVYSDDMNVQYSIADPFIPDEALWLPYGEDYMTYYYTAFPKRDNICAIIIPEFGSSYWVDDSFCPAYVEPPEENPKGITVIQRTDTHFSESSINAKLTELTLLLEEARTFTGTYEEYEAFLDLIDQTSDELQALIENYEISEDEVWINQTQLQWRPTPNTILIRYKKSSTPAFVVPEPVNLEDGIIEGHGDLLYFGSGKDGYLIHEDLEYNEYYSYTLWNIETRLNEDNDEIYVFNKYTGDSYHPYCYPITDTVHATILMEEPQYDAINLISNSTFDSNLSGWVYSYYQWSSGKALCTHTTWPYYAALVYPDYYSPTTINGQYIQTLFFETNLTNTFCSVTKNLGLYLIVRKDNPTVAKTIKLNPCATGDGGLDPSREVEILNVNMSDISGMSLEEIYNTYKSVAWSDYSNTFKEQNFTGVFLYFMGTNTVWYDNIYLWEHPLRKCDINGDPIIE